MKCLNSSKCLMFTVTKCSARSRRCVSDALYSFARIATQLSHRELPLPVK